MSFLEPRVSFSSNLTSFFHVMRYNSSVLFHLKLYILSRKEPIKVQIFRLSTARMKINQIPNVILQVTSQFSCKFCIALQCHDTWFLWKFLGETLYSLDKEPIKVQFFRLLSALRKFHPIPHAIFESTRSEEFIQILHHCSLPWNTTPLYVFTLDKESPSKWNFQTFEWMGRNSPNSACHIWNQKPVFL